MQLPFECNLVYYGKNIVASVSERTKAAVIDYIGRYPSEHCFETPNLHMLDVALKPFNLKVCFMAEYFLPDMNSFKLSDCRYSLKIIEPPFDGLYLPQWSNALCERRAECDVLAVGAFDKGRLVGLAGASAAITPVPGTTYHAIIRFSAVKSNGAVVQEEFRFHFQA